MNGFTRVELSLAAKEQKRSCSMSGLGLEIEWCSVVNASREKGLTGVQ
jgi:hypothetical protein